MTRARLAVTVCALICIAPMVGGELLAIALALAAAWILWADERTNGKD